MHYMNILNRDVVREYITYKTNLNIVTDIYEQATKWSKKYKAYYSCI